MKNNTFITDKKRGKRFLRYHFSKNKSDSHHESFLNNNKIKIITHIIEKQSKLMMKQYTKEKQLDYGKQKKKKLTFSKYYN